MTSQLRGPALSKAVRERIKQYIIDNYLVAGDMLPSEGQFASDLGVGRSSVREAVKALQSLGIIEARHGNGLFVRELNFDPVVETLDYGFRFNADSIGELFQIRLWLELAVIGDAVTQATDDIINELEEIINEWEGRVSKGESEAELDELFHKTLYASLNNQSLLGLIEVFWSVFADIDDPRFKGYDPIDGFERHRKLLDAIKKRDRKLSRKRLADTFDNLRERLNVPPVNIE